MKNSFTYVSLIIIHFLIGTLIYFNGLFSKVYFYAALVYFLYQIIFVGQAEKTKWVLRGCAYFVGAEVLFRTTKGAISYEASKYLVIVFMAIGIFYKGISGKAYAYFFYLMFLIPSIFVASTTLRFDANFRTNIAFVLSGPVCLGIAALYTYQKKISFKDLNGMMVYILLPIVAHVAYTIFYAPDLKEILNSTASNTAASGGFGANQVATVFGLGMFIVAVRFFMSSPSLSLKIINISLFGLISYRALVTLSRGGVFAAFIAIGVFLFFYFNKVNFQKKGQLLMLSFMFIVGFAAVWTYSSFQSNGMLDKRYANEDSLGREKEDISTGRFDLFQEELEGFVSNPFFGIGSSRAKDQRIEADGQGAISHNELSRTLAEHGIFGVIILVILLFKPFALRTSNRNIFFFPFLCLWFATINHSSMRIAMPAFMYALALLNVTHEKNPVRRKRLKAQVN